MGIDSEPTIPSRVVSATLPMSRIFGRPNKESPTLIGIQHRLRAEQAQILAQRAAREARELVERVQQQADEKHAQACARLIEAEKAVARVAEAKKQVKYAAKVEQRAQELSKEIRKFARRKGSKLVRKAKKERTRSKRMYKDAERAIAAANRVKDRTLKAAEGKSRQAEASMALAEDVSRIAAERARKAMEKDEEAVERLAEGIQPIVTPSLEQVVAAKWRIQYKEECFHFAVAGVSGRRKSSLINALRGLRGRDAAATVGSTRKTLQMTRYPDANPKKPFVWYDIPGTSTLKCRDWQWFNNQGLYVFDCIVVPFDNRFTLTDIAILVNARRFDIPTYIICPNADQHIRKVMRRKRHSKKGDDEDVEHHNKLYEAARAQFIEKTRKSVQAFLDVANLPHQRVYIVSNTALLSVVRNTGNIPKKAIDEVELLNDVVNQAYSRRELSA